MSVGLWVKVGTRHENSREAGISHFLEHMVFKGTERRTALDIAHEIDQVGGEFNAFTTREYTCFHLLVLAEDADLALDVLSDVILHSQFDAEELERERRVILQEIAMVSETPEELIYDRFHEIGYGTNRGLGRDILGSQSSIRRLSRGEILRFFRKYYRPDQCVLSIAGDITHVRARELARKRLSGRWPGRPARGKGPAPSPPLRPQPRADGPRLREGVRWIVRPSEQVHLLWGVDAPHYASRDRMAVLLLNTLLGGGMSSLLFQEIREKKGMAYTVYSSLQPFVDTGVLNVYVATSIPQLPACLKLVEEAAAKLARELIPEDALASLKQNLKGTILISADGVEARMSSIAKNEIFLGRFVGPDEVTRMIEEVTAQDIKRVARRWLGRLPRALVIVGSRPSAALRRKVLAALPGGAPGKVRVE